MLTNRVHVCLARAGAPDPDAEFEEGARFVCSCESNFVYREGFNLAGHLVMAWWEAPPLPAPRRRVRDLLIRPRRGS